MFDSNLHRALIDAKIEEINCLANYFNAQNFPQIINLNELRISLLDEFPSHQKINELFEKFSNTNVDLLISKQESGRILFQKFSEVEAMCTILFVELWT